MIIALAKLLGAIAFGLLLLFILLCFTDLDSRS